jgi:hypothetical protein
MLVHEAWYNNPRSGTPLISGGHCFTFISSWLNPICQGKYRIECVVKSGTRNGDRLSFLLIFAKRNVNTKAWYSRAGNLFLKSTGFCWLSSKSRIWIAITRIQRWEAYYCAIRNIHLSGTTAIKLSTRTAAIRAW